MLKNQINYQTSWARLYLLCGVLFGVLFVVGAIILRDWFILFNILAAILIMGIGWGMLRYPYATYTSNEIKVFGFFGTERKHYTFDSKAAIDVSNHRLYLNGKRLQINRWLVDKADYKRMEAFFDREKAFMNELTD